jgi:hypothetical protein
MARRVRPLLTQGYPCKNLTGFTWASVRSPLIRELADENVLKIFTHENMQIFLTKRLRCSCNQYIINQSEINFII